MSTEQMTERERIIIDTFDKLAIASCMELRAMASANTPALLVGLKMWSEGVQAVVDLMKECPDMCIEELEETTKKVNRERRSGYEPEEDR
tara:strand:+ start:447 stop:716 length:270 start_codon:yes stop_codon:yes gene_type:complete